MTKYIIVVNLTHISVNDIVVWLFTVFKGDLNCQHVKVSNYIILKYTPSNVCFASKTI